MLINTNTLRECIASDFEDRSQKAWHNGPSVGELKRIQGNRLHTVQAVEELAEQLELDESTGTVVVDREALTKLIRAIGSADFKTKAKDLRDAVARLIEIAQPVGDVLGKPETAKPAVDYKEESRKAILDEMAEKGRTPRFNQPDFIAGPWMLDPETGTHSSSCYEWTGIKWEGFVSTRGHQTDGKES